MAKDKRPLITLADLAKNPNILKNNPHLFPGVTLEAVMARLRGDSRPVSAQKSIRVAAGPKTRPERLMEERLKKEMRDGDGYNVVSYEYEGITLKIGDGVKYTPDFVVFGLNAVIRLIEVKGSYFREDAIVKWKVAKAKYFMFKFEFWSLQKDDWIRMA